MVQPAIPLAFLIKDLTAKQLVIEEALSNPVTAERASQIRAILLPVIRQIRELSAKQKDFGPLDIYFNDKPIEQLNNYSNRIIEKFNNKQDELGILARIESTIKKVDGYRQKMMTAIEEKKLDAAPRDMQSYRAEINRLKMMDFKIPGVKEKISRLDRDFLDAERAFRQLPWEKSLEGAVCRTGRRNQFDLPGGGSSMCACAAYLGLVAMLRNQVEDIDAILDSALKNYKALIYFLKNENRNNPEAPEYTYGLHLDYIESLLIAPELENLAVFNGQELWSTPLQNGHEGQAITSTLKEILGMIPQDKTRIGRQITLGNETYSIVMHKDKDLTIDLFDLRQNAPAFHSRHRSRLVQPMGMGRQPSRRIHTAADFLLGQARKPGGERKIKVFNRDPIVGQFLIEGEEKTIYFGMFAALSEIMAARGKKEIGAMFLCGKEFYSVMILEKDDGSFTVDLFDSHGAFSYLPLNQAYQIHFPNLEKAAEYLALRKPCTPNSRTDNECTLLPMLLKEGEVQSFLDTHPLPDNESVAILFDQCLKTLKDNDPAGKGVDAKKKQERIGKIKNWSQTDFFSSLNHFPLHLKAFAKAIGKASNSPLFEKLDALMAGYREKRDASPDQRMAKEEQLMALLIDLQTSLPADYEALNENWSADANERKIRKNQSTPDQRIAGIEKYVSDQLLIQWMKLPHPVCVNLVEIYKKYYLTDSSVENEIGRIMNQCKEKARAIEGNPSQDTLITVKSDVEKLNQSIISLIRCKVTVGLNENDTNKLKELEELYKNLCVQFNEVLGP